MLSHIINSFEKASEIKLDYAPGNGYCHLVSHLEARCELKDRRWTGLFSLQQVLGPNILLLGVTGQMTIESTQDAAMAKDEQSSCKTMNATNKWIDLLRPMSTEIDMAFSWHHLAARRCFTYSIDNVCGGVKL